MTVSPDVFLVALPLEGVTFDADTRTGTIQLGGGLVIDGPGGTKISLVNPEVVIRADNASSGLFATIDGVRVKVGDIDTSNLNLNVGDGTVTIDDLDVTVGGALTPLLAGVLGAGRDPGRHPAPQARPQPPRSSVGEPRGGLTVSGLD